MYMSARWKCAITNLTQRASSTMPITCTIWSIPGISFAQMQEKGVIPVLNRVEIDYKTPLRSGDRFVSKLWVERKGARFVFHQDLFKTDTGESVVSAVVSCVCLSDGKLDRGDMLAEVFKKHLR